MGPLAVTMGDPAGIGGELTLRSWLSRSTPPFFALDDPDHLRTLATRLHLNVPIETIEHPNQATHTFATALPVIPVKLHTPPTPGHPTQANAAAVIASIERATTYALIPNSSAP